MTDKNLSDDLPFVDETTSEFLRVEPESIVSEKEFEYLDDYDKVSQRLSTMRAIEEEENWADYDRDSKKLRNERYREDTRHRRNLSTWAASIVSMWLIAVMLILIFNKNKIGLENSTLIALLSTTTLNILGMMFIVLRGLFENKD